jgi:ADP-ribose pyrophosphatase YjhB (NUDIX family)
LPRIFDEKATTALFQSAKTLTQVAALPYIELGSRIDILLVTSRRRGRWILPRGWPVEGKPFASASAREARQEAGAVGEISQVSIGDYSYNKRMEQGYRVPCRVYVYPLRVTHQCLDWREKAERNQRWSDITTASAIVRQQGLADFLRDLARRPNLATSLNALVEQNHVKAN